MGILAKFSKDLTIGLAPSSVLIPAGALHTRLKFWNQQENAMDSKFLLTASKIDDILRLGVGNARDLRVGDKLNGVL